MIGHYRNREMNYNYLSDTQSSTRFSIGGIVQYKSYVWHPNFLLLDIEAEYNPDFIKENFVVIPDQSETRTTKRLNLSGTLFNTKIVSLHAIANFSQVYQNRENLTNVKSDTKQAGGILSFSNKKLPVSIRLYQTNWTQEETETGRLTTMDHLNLTGRVSKSFFSRDKHEFTYSFDKHTYRYLDFYTALTQSHFYNLTDYIAFDPKENLLFRSYLSYRSQAGSMVYDRFQANENLTVKLPYRFMFVSNYGNNTFIQENQRTQTQTIKNTISHKLFLSLNTNLNYEYRKTDHLAYQEEDRIFGGSVYYTKKIPVKGKLNLSYHYKRQNHRTESEPTSFQVIDEHQVLSDGQIALLERPYAEATSVTVRDETGAIIYILNIDYILIERGNYIEIQRFPGGQIANGSSVYIDYIVNLPETNSYDSNLHRFSGSISILNGLFEIYTHLTHQDFVRLENVDLLILNYLTQYRYGARFDLKFISGGCEYENYQSTIIPYEMMRVFLTGNKYFNERMLVSLNANLQKYNYQEEEIDHIYADISSKLAYRIMDKTKVGLDLGYRKQIGSGIDLDLFTARLEGTSQIHQLYITLGIEKYTRNFLGETNDYTGIYFKLVRRF